MTITQVDTNIQELLKTIDQPRFVYDFLLAFGLPKSTIKRLESGAVNMSKNVGEVILKKKLWYKELTSKELDATMKTIKALDKIKHNPRFVMLTDGKRIVAWDTKENESLDIEMAELTKEYAFFLPLAGMDKVKYQDENPADVKAAEKMAKLFDEIRKHNPTETPEERKRLNVFLTRLLFCFFAEDTDIFEDNQFTNTIASHTQEDGSDLQEFLIILFEVLNLPNRQRSKDIPKYFETFPYVNGGLFEGDHDAPEISAKARKLILESGGLDWKHIHPDIFGSMMQAVVSPEHRGGLGMHYTSVPNIMKVIEPLFLNELYEEFEKNKKNSKKLQELLARLSNLKIFDPACGSGNFLIIAYQELRKLEIHIFKQMAAIKGTLGSGQLGFDNEFKSVISLSQFYGIEIDAFAHEVASLSLWLAEHQMNTIFLKEFGNTKPTLPLRDGGNIAQGNACRLDWEEVCPKEEGKEVFILGNPPYLGNRYQKKTHKEDLAFVCSEIKSFGNLDYISCWFIKACQYLKEQKKSAVCFVSTNSICQGTQVPVLWSYLFGMGMEISFAYQSFKWQNNAKSNAGVHCIIVGMMQKSNSIKKLFTQDNIIEVKNINGYLLSGKHIEIHRRKSPISNLNPMDCGSKATDGGNLILSKNEVEELIRKSPNSSKYIKRIFGAEEILNGKERWCLWINEKEVNHVKNIPEINERIEACKSFRNSSSKIATQKKAEKSFQFDEVKHKNTVSLIIPTVTSERRQYLPVGYLNKEQIIIAPNNAIYNPDLFVFGILSSSIHMIWIKTVSGKLENRLRYSSSICYNSFPFPKINDTQKSELEENIYKILKQREINSDKTLAQLYDPNKMPEGLREAHHELDLAVERCYRKEPFTSDEERLAYLFKLYEKMIQKEKDQNTLFAKAKKPRKKKK